MKYVTSRSKPGKSLKLQHFLKIHYISTCSVCMNMETNWNADFDTCVYEKLCETLCSLFFKKKPPRSLSKKIQNGKE